MVRRLMKSWAAISGLDRPPPASRAIWASRAVSREGIGGALADSLAGGHQLTRGSFREPVSAHGGEHLVRGAQLLARVFLGIDAEGKPLEQVARPLTEVGSAGDTP